MSAAGNEWIMYGMGLSAVRITGWMMVASACSGAAIDFKSQTGGTGGAGPDAAGGGGTGGAKPAQGGARPVGSGGRVASAGTGGSVQTGGSAAGGAGGSAGSSGGVGGEPPVTDGSCRITSVRSDPDGANARRSYLRVTFDAAARVLTWEHTDQRDPSLLLSREQRLVNAQGQLLVQTGEEFVNSDAYSSWRFDDLRDVEGNLLETMATYTRDFDFSITPPPPHYSWAHYAHTYDASGALVSTLTTDSVGNDFTSRNFFPDDQGRCARIERSGERSEVETRTYDGERLASSNIEGGTYQLVGDYRYDQQGRLVGYERDGSYRFSGSRADGVPNLTTSYEYADDGSVTVTLLDYDNDVSSDQRTVWLLSPGCSEIWAALPKSAEAKCSFPDSASVASVLDLVE